ncbi:lysosomal alpha-mannosidase-like [Daphnia pulex]|uniref:lysosomal alpha-mannosidase-like n=1 Tax=Daphnia pulex TaxID=6669 RepID=UPI001EDFD058|nr:lysosomal alpha-mannosidase-like [Daphnia pulex]
MKLPFIGIVSLLAFGCCWITTDAAPQQRASSCGYDSCTPSKPGVINVHVVPHTHDDVGWLKTVDQYYYGSKTGYQRAGVQYIIDSVIKELVKDPARRFIYVEMAFFSQWWQEQTEEKKAVVKQLVEEGRLEFINGGWCMNDEAGTHYNDIIDQMTWGMRFLNDTFGECGRPKIGWQIDPFGHSREQASIFASMGFDGVFFGRIDWVDRTQRKAKKEMEMIWHTSNSPGEPNSIFTGIFYEHYSAPNGFCFDVVCRDEPFIDSPRSADYNVVKKVKDLEAHIKAKALSYSTSNIMLTMGDDFNYMSADMNFKNMDKMIRYTNELASGVNLFYSTPSCYVKAINNEAGSRPWPTKTDDFFPYSNDPHAYWTGYFTSRPAYKGTVRKANTFLQSCKQLHSLAGQSAGGQNLIDSLRRSMGEAQHHDAVAGTEKEHVSQDYRLRLHDSLVDCQKDVGNSFSQLLPIGSQALPPQEFCLHLNVSQCAITESSSRFVTTVYNPRSHEVTTYVRLPVMNGVYTVLDPDGSELIVQLVPLVNAALRSIETERPKSSATHELVFQAASIPALGHKTFYIVKSSARHGQQHSTITSSRERQSTTVRMAEAGERIAVSNGKLSVNFDANGLIESVVVDGVTVMMSQNLMWYAGMNEGNANSIFDDRPSGAYVFRPNGTDATPISTQATLIVQTGALVSEVYQQFSDWASQVVRVYKGQSDVEIEWTVGPIPVGDGIGKEIVSRVTTQIPSGGRFYTDSNGRQTLLRRRDFRPTWTLDVTEPVSGNYYPINSHIYVTDSEQNAGAVLALVNDRSQGGTSLKDGQIELMVHRRLLYDDHFGVGEPLNEPGDGPGLVVRGTHYLLVNPSLAGNHPVSLIRPLAQQMFMRPWMSFSATSLSFTNWKNNFRTEKSGLRAPLPDNVHILTLEPWRDGTHLLRLEHVYDIGEHSTLSEPVTLILDDLLADYTITSAVETTLGANQWASESSRLPWTTADANHQQPLKKVSSKTRQSSGKTSVTLLPMEIRTFIIQMTPK